MCMGKITSPRTLYEVLGYTRAMVAKDFRTSWEDWRWGDASENMDGLIGLIGGVVISPPAYALVGTYLYIANRFQRCGDAQPSNTK